MTRSSRPFALSADDTEWVEWRARELMGEQGLGRLRAMDQALAELRADVARLGEDDLIRAHGGDPVETDRRIADR